MYELKEKPKENKRKPVANSVAQRNTNKGRGSNVDKRSRAVSKNMMMGANMVIQCADSWDIRNSAKRHFDDGWGAAYQIRGVNALKQKILTDGEDAEGDLEIDLGTKRQVGTNNIKDCSIAYNNYNNGAGCDTRVWHCGPSNQ